MPESIKVTKQIIPGRQETQEFDLRLIEEERDRVIKHFNNNAEKAYYAMLSIAIMHTALARVFYRGKNHYQDLGLAPKTVELIDQAVYAHAIVESLKAYIVNTHTKGEAGRILKNGEAIEIGLKEWLNNKILEVDNNLASLRFREDIGGVDASLQDQIKRYHRNIFAPFHWISYLIAASVTPETGFSLLFAKNSPSEVYEVLENGALPLNLSRKKLSEIIASFNKGNQVFRGKNSYELPNLDDSVTYQISFDLSKVLVSHHHEITKNDPEYSRAKLPYNIDFIFPEAPISSKIKELIKELPEGFRPGLISQYGLPSMLDPERVDLVEKMLIKAVAGYGTMDGLLALSAMIAIEKAKLELYKKSFANENQADPRTIHLIAQKIAILEEVRRRTFLKAITNIIKNNASQDIKVIANDLNNFMSAINETIEEVTDRALKDQNPPLVMAFLRSLELGLILSLKPFRSGSNENQIIANRFGLYWDNIDNIRLIPAFRDSHKNHFGEVRFDKELFKSKIMKAIFDQSANGLMFVLLLNNLRRSIEDFEIREYLDNLRNNPNLRRINTHIVSLAIADIQNFAYRRRYVDSHLYNLFNRQAILDPRLDNEVSLNPQLGFALELFSNSLADSNIARQLSSDTVTSVLLEKHLQNPILGKPNRRAVMAPRTPVKEPPNVSAPRPRMPDMPAPRPAPPQPEKPLIANKPSSVPPSADPFILNLPYSIPQPTEPQTPQPVVSSDKIPGFRSVGVQDNRQFVNNLINKLPIIGHRLLETEEPNNLSAINASRNITIGNQTNRQPRLVFGDILI